MLEITNMISDKKILLKTIIDHKIFFIQVVNTTTHKKKTEIVFFFFTFKSYNIIFIWKSFLHNYITFY